ncbi:hypothetical protein [Niastella populi]|uniref:Uncharacterized protein n=1 Tax=Niastella populi TaxID=550983 RepID=A0A1V9F5J3_9BACT|nr:hypothetical protein [Niastella populi]OQP53561.1 hypothetical protein A4R26_06175 [Niastella populi]
MDINFIKVELSVAKKDRKIFANLIFSNNTSETVSIDKLRTCHGNKIQNNLFKIFDEKKRMIDYDGPMVKRFITPEDFIMIDPGQKIETSVELDEVYELKNGKKYTIQYSAYLNNNLTNSSIEKIESNVVEVIC